MDVFSPLDLPQCVFNSSLLPSPPTLIKGCTRPRHIPLLLSSPAYLQNDSCPHTADMDTESETNFALGSLEPLSAFPTPPDSCDTSLWEDRSSCSTSHTSASIHSQANRHLKRNLNGSAKFNIPEVIAQTRFLKGLLPPATSRLPVPPRSPSEYDMNLKKILYNGRHIFSSSVIAMAGCILDALSPKFVSKWLAELASSSSGTLPPPTSDLIVIVALIISTKFLNDKPPHNIHFQIHVFDETFCLKSICATERCMLEDVNYRLGFFGEEKVWGEKVKSLERAVEGELKKRQKASDASQEGEEMEMMNEGDWDDLELEPIEDLDEDFVADESRMLAVFHLDDSDFDDDDD